MKEKTMKNFRKNPYWNALITLCAFFLFSFFGGFTASKTALGQIDALTYRLNDYNNHTINGDFIRPYVRIEDKNVRDRLYTDLLRQFYYSDDSGSIRQLMQNECDVEIGGSKHEIVLYSQDILGIQNTISADGGYRIDYGIFHAYFSDSELGERGYLGKRFNCDTYIFISDTFADALLEEYGLAKTREAYLSLIKEEQYAILHINVDGLKDITLSINNIIYSDKRMGARCSYFNKYFGLINYNYVSDVLQPAFEIDLKAYSYYISSVLDKTEQMGYGVGSYNYRFYKYDYSKGKYFEDYAINDSYALIRSDGLDDVFKPLFIATVAATSFLFGVLIYYFQSTSFAEIVEICVMTLSLSVFSVISNFIYVSFLTSVVPLCLCLVFVCMKGGGVCERMLAEHFEKHSLGKENRSEIQI